MENRIFKKGEVIIEEGTLSEGAYIIESGSVAVSKKIPNGESQTLSILNRNDIFGEMGLIDQLPRSATVTALEECCISIMTPETFDSLAKKNPKALMPILKILAKRIRNTLKIIEDVGDHEPQNQPVVAGSL